MDERIELVFGTGSSFHLSCTVLNGNSDSSKIRVHYSGTLSQNPDLENFTMAYRSSKHVINLDKGGRSEHDKLDRRWSTRLTVPPSSDSRPLVYHTNKLCLQDASVAWVC